jgi:peptidoglycan/LPS O-acetylase OafA/YrhL
MQSNAGTLSHDGRWLWDGTRWRPAYSPDGQWWWNGVHWVRTAAPKPPVWQPAWTRADTVAVTLWLSVVPIVLAALTVAIGLAAHLTLTGGLVATVTAYTAWAFVGGITVRPHGRWREVVLIAAALVAVLLIVDLIGLVAVAATGNDKPSDDDGAAVGMLFLVLLVFPPTLLPVACGRLLRRSIARSDRPA